MIRAAILRRVGLVCAIVGASLTLSGCFGPRPALVLLSPEPSWGTLSYENPSYIVEFGVAPEPEDYLDFSPAFITIQLTNKTQSIIRLIWDEAAIVDPQGVAHRVFHSNVRFLDRSQSVPPSIIPPGSQLRDIFAPIDRTKWTGKRWDVEPLLEAKHIGGQLRVLLPMVVGDQRYDETYVFRVVKQGSEEAKRG